MANAAEQSSRSNAPFGALSEQGSPQTARLRPAAPQSPPRLRRHPSSPSDRHAELLQVDELEVHVLGVEPQRLALAFVSIPVRIDADVGLRPAWVATKATMPRAGMP